MATRQRSEEQFDSDEDKGIEEDLMDEQNPVAAENGGGDDHKNEEEDGGGMREKVLALDEPSDRRGGMAKSRRSEELVEQIDFDGDKDTEGMMDEENPVAKDNGHGKEREFGEEDGERSIGDGDDHKEEENDVGRREKASMLEESGDRRGGIAERQRSEEQIDFDGDKGIEEDMMDEENLVAEDNGHIQDLEEFGKEDGKRSYGGGDDTTKDKDDGGKRRERVTTMEESANQRSSMAERQRSEEPEEQIDFDGDKDIEEDMMDEENLMVEDNGHAKDREEFDEEDEVRSYGGANNHKEEGDSDGRREKVPTLQEFNGVASEAVEEIGRQEEPKEPFEVKDDQGIRKWEELLALPPHGSEVFLGGLPRDASEEEFRELAEPFGDIFEVRVMKDKYTKESRGFAFIVFTSSNAAQKAVKGIHEKIFKERTLRCSLSQAKHRLFIGNVPRSLMEEELGRILENTGPGVQHIEMLKDPHNRALNCGFVFVEFYNHACAEYAKQKMSHPNYKMEGTNPVVSWADFKNSVDSSAAAQVKAIYVKNLPDNTSTERLKELFEQNGEVTKVVLPPAKHARGNQDFGFIHFAERSSALKAIETTGRYEIDGHILAVSLAKPQADKKSHHSTIPWVMPNFPACLNGFAGDPYGAYSGWCAAAGFGQPKVYDRGTMPAEMRMVSMVLPDGSLGYVIQQPSALPSPPPSWRDVRSGGSSEYRSRDSDRYRQSSGLPSPRPSRRAVRVGGSGKDRSRVNDGYRRHGRRCSPYELGDCAAMPSF